VSVAFDKLHVTRWLNAYGELMPTDEARVKQALEFYFTPKTEVIPDWLQGMPEGYAIDFMRNLRMTDLMRTGGVFVLDPADVWANFDTEHITDPSALPPCPFRRMFFEFWDADGSALLANFRDLDGEACPMLGVGVVEETPCVEWRVYWLMRSTKFGVQDYAIREYELRAEDGMMKYGMDVNEFEQSELSEGEKMLWKGMAGELPRLCVEACSLLGAVRESVRVPRQHKRAYRRAQPSAPPFPTIYKVDLHGAGDPEGSGSGREYHCRWIVRGHYRSEPNGEYDVPGKGKCGWVRAHVKGPAGAPWRGRPVHVGTEDEAA
jgi:hypothetical protein